MGLLDGKAVVITGGGRGIGAACAKAIARQGAAVVVNAAGSANAETTAAGIHAEGGSAIAVAADISRWDEAGRLIQSCLDAFGRIDGLVNNAALTLRGLLADYDPQAAQRLFEVNVFGTFNCAAHAVKPMIAQGSGSIVNVVSGAQMGLPMMGVYGATKGAVSSAIYTWAMELKDAGVRVNGFSPLAATKIGDADEEAYQMRRRLLPEPETITFAVEYLLSDLAAQVTGQIVRVDREKVVLLTHPALLIPPAVREHWTVEALAEAFETEFKDRQIECGVRGATEPSIPLGADFWGELTPKLRAGNNAEAIASRSRPHAVSEGQDH